MSAFPGYYQTGDAGVIDADGMIHIMGRTDDVINVAGHRLSTGALEEVVASIDSVAECAVVGVADRLKGQLPTALMVLKAGTEKPSEAVSLRLWRWFVRKLARLLPLRMQLSLPGYRKRALVRFCGPRCVQLQKIARTKCLQQSMIQRSLMKSKLH